MVVRLMANERKREGGGHRDLGIESRDDPTDKRFHVWVIDGLFAPYFFQCP